MTTTNDTQPDGRDALTAVFDAKYPDQEPVHVGYGDWVGQGAGTGSPLFGCSAYNAGDHWHYVTYGLTELFDKESPDPNWSGFGFELTFRVARGEETTAPEWPFVILATVARYVWQGTALRAGDFVDFQQPVTGYPTLPDAPDSLLTAFLVLPDLDLDMIETRNGKVRFTQLLGLTSAERAHVAADGPVGDLVEDLAHDNPLLVTVLDRDSVIDPPAGPTL